MASQSVGVEPLIDLEADDRLWPNPEQNFLDKASQAIAAIC